MSIFSKLKTLFQINSAFKQVEEGIKMKNSTKIIAGVFAVLTAILQVTEVQHYILHLIDQHPAVSIILAGLSGILALLHQPNGQKSTSSSSGNATKLLIFALVLFPLQLSAQNTLPVNMYGGGLSYNLDGVPHISGTAFQAHKLGDSGTYTLEIYDALPVKVPCAATDTTCKQTYTVSSSIGAGVFQTLFDIGKITLMTPNAMGVQYTGQNLGWQYSTGIIALIPVKKHFLAPMVRLGKGSVGGGYNPIFGLTYAF